MDQNVREETIRNLKDAGCGADMIGNFMKQFDEKNIQEQFTLLEQQRDRLLERVHREEKRISCLDYLAYQIRKRTAYLRCNGHVETKSSIRKDD